MLTKQEQKLAVKAIKRKKLFLVISIIGVIVGLSLALFYFWKSYVQPDFEVGSHFILVVMILLNARLNLRQYRYARILETVMLRKNIVENSLND